MGDSGAREDIGVIAGETISCLDQNRDVAVCNCEKEFWRAGKAEIEKTVKVGSALAYQRTEFVVILSESE